MSAHKNAFDGYTVFPFPTLANPNRLHDVESLRAELDHANREMLWSRAALTELKERMKQHDACLRTLIACHAAGRADLVTAILNALARINGVPAGDPDGRMH